jgi:hypothetical protein
VFALEKWRSFWARLFGSSRGSVRQRKVLEYIVHRIGEGARLEEIVQEEYVRRQAAPAEVERILSHPELVEAAREGIRKELGTGGRPRKDAASEPEPATARVVAGGLKRSDGLLCGRRFRILQGPVIEPRLTEGG